MVLLVQPRKVRAALGQAAQVGGGLDQGRWVQIPGPFEPAQGAASSAASSCFLLSICKLPGKSLIVPSCLGQG